MLNRLVMRPLAKLTKQGERRRSRSFFMVILVGPNILLLRCPLAMLNGSEKPILVSH